jgi:hypothetical protein
MLCLSDLHLGDNKSVLNDPKNVVRVLDDLAGYTNEHVGTLVLNGDIWEQCIPAGTMEENPGDGFCSSVAKASRFFFGTLFQKIRVDKVVWVPGNHDLSLWKRLSDAGSLPFYTSSDGEMVLGSSSGEAKRFFDVLLGDNAPLFDVAYPLYIADKAPGDDFPYVMFTHGHLMDDLVLGYDSGAVYEALKAIGCKRPTLPDYTMPSVKSLAEHTDGFTLALWKENSKIGYEFWNQIARRLSHPQSCPLGDGDVSTNITNHNHPSSPRDGLAPKVRDFLDKVLTDPNLPTPVGSLRDEVLAPAFLKPSCMVYGHDHMGTAERVIACGVPFQVYDSGGWTSEFEGHKPHTHALIWYDEPGTIPGYVYLATT